MLKWQFVFGIIVFFYVLDSMRVTLSLATSFWLTVTYQPSGVMFAALMAYCVLETTFGGDMTDLATAMTSQPFTSISDLAYFRLSWIGSLYGHLHIWTFCAAISNPCASSIACLKVNFTSPNSFCCMASFLSPHTS